MPQTSIVRTILLLAIIAASIAHAQDVPTYSVNVQVVNVLANVFDKHGAIVRDLEQKNGPFNAVTRVKVSCSSLETRA